MELIVTTSTYKTILDSFISLHLGDKEKTNWAKSEKQYIQSLVGKNVHARLEKILEPQCSDHELLMIYVMSAKKIKPDHISELESCEQKLLSARLHHLIGHIKAIKEKCFFTKQARDPRKTRIIKRSEIHTAFHTLPKQNKHKELKTLCLQIKYRYQQAPQTESTQNAIFFLEKIAQNVHLIPHPEITIIKFKQFYL